MTTTAAILAGLAGLAGLGALLLCSGCLSSSLAARLNKLPDGRFDSATFTETDKFTSTTIRLEGVVKDNGNFAASVIHFSHTNPWITDLKFDAVNYEAQLTAATKRKLFPEKIQPPTP